MLIQPRIRAPGSHYYWVARGNTDSKLAEDFYTWPGTHTHTHTYIYEMNPQDSNMLNYLWYIYYNLRKDNSSYRLFRHKGAASTCWSNLGYVPQVPITTGWPEAIWIQSLPKTFTHDRVHTHTHTYYIFILVPGKSPSNIALFCHPVDPLSSSSPHLFQIPPPVTVRYKGGPSWIGLLTAYEARSHVC